LKKSFLALEIVGVLFVFFGAVAALQGDGMIGGSPMSGNPFWIYAGSGVAIVGALVAILGFVLGSRSRVSMKPTANETTENAEGSSTTSSSSPTKK